MGEQRILPLDRIFRLVDKNSRWPLGTGFTITTNKIAVTALHVVDLLAKNEIMVDFGDWNLSEASISGTDPNLHIAFIKMSKSVCEVSPLIRWPKIGEPIYVCGYPQPDINHNMEETTGIRVCGSIIMAEVGYKSNHRIELQGAFPKGFSGSPIIAMSDGALLGMLDAVGFSALHPEAGIGFHLGLAVPANLIVSLL